jgi:hypothetical protein
MLNPKVSFLTKEASGNTSFFQTLLIVGQSNDATAGLYKNLENLSPKQLEVKFGTNSHLTSVLKEVYQTFKNSIIKPKLWSVSYQDKSDAVKRVLESTVSGTATESGTIKVKINSMNPDRIAAKAAAILALRNTKGAYAGDYAANSELFGSPSKAAMGFNPILSDVSTQDLIIEVSVSKSDSAATVAAAINTAIGANNKSIYDSTVDSAVVTLTAEHKGELGNFFTIEYLDIPAGLSIATVEDTAGSGVVVTSGILDLTDSDGLKLSELDFDYVVAPYSYSVSTLVTDAKSKWDNVLEYNNRCLDYQILQATAIDTSTSSNIDDLAEDNALSAEGIDKTLFVAMLDGFKIRGITEYSERALLESYQLSPIQYDLVEDQVTIGNTYTLYDGGDLFVKIESKLNASRVRTFIVEKCIPADFQERNFTFGNAANSFTYNKDDVISKFEYYRDILDGTIVTSDFKSDWSGLLDNSSSARSNFSEYLAAVLSFDKVSGQLIVGMANEITSPIKSIFITAFYK